MRLVLILIVIIAILALIQTKRHNCEFGSDDWFDCVVTNTQKEFLASTGDSGPRMRVATISR
jgi:hypothetical protein